MLFDLVGLDDSCNIDIGCSNGGFADCDAVLVVGLVFRSRSSKKGQQRGGSGRFLESRRRRLNSQSSSSSSSSSCKRFGFKRAHFFFLLKWNFFFCRNYSMCQEPTKAKVHDIYGNIVYTIHNQETAEPKCFFTLWEQKILELI